MVENFKAHKYSDGSAIPTAKTYSDWFTTNTGAYGWYNSDITNETTNGALYNWFAVSSGKLAPTGWHIPTDAEWSVLESYMIVNGYNYDGTTVGNKIAKSLSSTSTWNTSTNTGAIGNNLSENNRAGFSAISSGAWDTFSTGTLYNGLGYFCGWWTTTGNITDGGPYVNLGFSSNFLRHSVNNQQVGYSVRCVKD